MARPIRWGRTTCPICRDRITNNALGREAHIRHCLPDDRRFRVFSEWIRGRDRWTWERRDGLGVGQGYYTRSAAFDAAHDFLEKQPYVERYIP